MKQKSRKRMTFRSEANAYHGIIYLYSHLVLVCWINLPRGYINNILRNAGFDHRPIHVQTKAKWQLYKQYADYLPLRRKSDTSNLAEFNQTDFREEWVPSIPTSDFPGSDFASMTKRWSLAALLPPAFVWGCDLNRIEAENCGQRRADVICDYALKDRKSFSWI